MHRLSAFVFAASICWMPAVRAQQGPASVVVERVVEREFAATQAFVANVKPRRMSVIGSAVDGRVEEFLVNAGQAVVEGQPLARLRTKSIEIELAGAKAELTLREAELLELENGSRPEEIELAEASARAAIANMEYAKSKLARAENLFKNASGMSQDEYESAQAAAIAATERTSEAQISLKLVRKGPRVEQIQQAQARVAVQQEVVMMLLDRLAKYTLRAPFDGFVSAESTETGAWVKQGDAIAEVVEIDPVEVEVFVPESSIRFVTQGDHCTIKVDAVGDQPFSGTVDQIIPLADNRSRTFPVQILVENPKVNSSHVLLPGMLARASLPIEQPQMRMLVPKDALQFGDGTQVLMKVQDGKAVLVPVRRGPSLDDWIAIESLAPGALRVGDQVVTRGNERLRPGQELIITQPQPPRK